MSTAKRWRASQKKNCDYVGKWKVPRVRCMTRRPKVFTTTWWTLTSFGTCDVMSFSSVIFFWWKFHTIQFSFDCATQWKNFHRSKFWLHIYRHSRTISSLTTNLELNDEHCSCQLASFSKAQIRCLLLLARLMSVLLQFIC